MSDVVIKDIPGYEGLYQATSDGEIISLPKKAKNRYGYRMTNKKILKPAKINSDYLFVCLCKNGKQKPITVHKLITLSFLGICPDGYQVNHIDSNKSNNCASNLEYVTARQNSIHYRQSQKKTSQYTGVSWLKRDQKWVAYIMINKKNYYLGSFDLEIDASNAYQKCLVAHLTGISIQSFLRPKHRYTK